ncbi:hypothetical protein BEWA_047330 [Theileria equi strain WA]|uniref:Uncharacterized protein n=1 Tax=Theileria equi strain WA TaxID=1537102 RepID=L1LAW2_THEEQ|nr:hypothetical protein BEWA_047330 [Theileria equi strain WA]EKX72268.1 hypothetical protein BEWA_047330 [Theileria equi strain WA]|eukprot:XP_004831720.1 hypothetical protein BEWA_047330 [Theileria equi strain WA]
MDSEIILWEAGSDTKCTVVNIYQDGEDTLLNLYVKKASKKGFRRFKKVNGKWMPQLASERIKIVRDDTPAKLKFENLKEQRGDDDVKSTDYGCEPCELQLPHGPEDDEDQWVQ